jgi:monoterpene epsilon-lactone hydrolase
MPSLISTLLKAQIILLNPLLNNMELATLRVLQDSLGSLGTRAAAHKAEFEQVDLGTCQASWVLPNDDRTGKAALYLHGGSYSAGSLEYAQGFGGMLALETGRDTLCLGYRLAPEDPFPAALEDALVAYRLLLTRFLPKDIAIVGESAGGGLCFCLALKLKQEGLPQPGRIVAMSPWVDLSVSLDACRAMKRDPMISCDGLVASAALYLNGHDPRDPLASPLYGDLSGLPGFLIITGGDEILLGESEEMHRRLREAGVPGELHVEEGMWHAYPLYPVPEARQAQAMMRDFLNVQG